MRVTPLILLACSGVAFATDIPIVNPSFESNPTGPGTFRLLVPTGWSVVDPGGIINGGSNSVGVANPSGTTFYPFVPDGNQVALIYLSQQIGTTPVALRQITGATLQPFTRYRLRVEVGNIASGFGPPNNYFYNLNGFPGYRVELLAGGVVIAQDSNSLGATLPEGGWATSTVTFKVGKSHPRLGQALEVRLWNLNQIHTPANPGIEANFDLVRLESVDLINGPRG